MASTKRSRTDSEDTDLLHLNHLAQQHDLMFSRDGNNYLFQSFVARGVPQALAFAEGVDRTRSGEPALYLGAKAKLAANPRGIQQRDAFLLKGLVEQHSIIITDDRYLAFELDAFKAFTLSDAIGFAKGVAHARSPNP
jgi:hypothetical protein